MLESLNSRPLLGFVGSTQPTKIMFFTFKTRAKQVLGIDKHSKHRNCFAPDAAEPEDCRDHAFRLREDKDTAEYKTYHRPNHPVPPTEKTCSTSSESLDLQQAKAQNNKKLVVHGHFSGHNNRKPSYPRNPLLPSKKA